MNELININYSNDRPTVLGRELHDMLGVETDYRHWFPRMCEYGFEEGKDFNPVKNDRVRTEGSRQVTRTVIDHQLTIPMAKEICMLQRTERGKECRQYFITIEEQWNSPDAIMQRALQIANSRLEKLRAENRMLLEKNVALLADDEHSSHPPLNQTRGKKGSEAKTVPLRWFNIRLYNNLYNAYPKTLRELAQEVGVHVVTLRAWRNGRSRPTVNNARKLAAVLGVDEKELFLE